MWLFRRRVNIPLLSALCVVLLLLCGVAPARAHMGGDANVRAVLDKVPTELRELSVQLVTLVAPELRVANPTDTPLEVLDPKGVPFISIGPKGVLGNFNAPSWYTTYDPSGRTPMPEDVRKRDEPEGQPEPRWSRITPQHSWGWFDHRLHQESPAPPEVVKAGVSADLGTWAVPVRYGGKTLRLSGRFVYQQVRGAFEYSFDEGKQQVELQPGLTLTLRPGGRGEIPTLTLKSTLPKGLVVYGIENEPFLGFTPKGVRVNRLSPTWLQIQRARGQAMPDAKADPDALPEVEQVADHPEFEWPELRALYGQPEPPENVILSGRPVDVLEWWVKFTIGDNKDEVVIGHSGKTRWVPAAQSPDVQTAGGGISAAVVGSGLAVLVAAVACLFALQRRRNKRRKTGVRSGR
jgi:hypothetical protein